MEAYNYFGINFTSIAFLSTFFSLFYMETSWWWQDKLHMLSLNSGSILTNKDEKILKYIKVMSCPTKLLVFFFFLTDIAIFIGICFVPHHKNACFTCGFLFFSFFFFLVLSCMCIYGPGSVNCIYFTNFTAKRDRQHTCNSSQPAASGGTHCYTYSLLWAICPSLCQSQRSESYKAVKFSSAGFH